VRRTFRTKLAGRLQGTWAKADGDVGKLSGLLYQVLEWVFCSVKGMARLS